jgi:hypothetical protein
MTVESGVNQATIRFNTRVPVFSILKWGQTTEYGEGTIRSSVFVTEHSVNINNLTPATRYFFSIDLEGKGGNIIYTYTGTFVTLALPQVRVVPNPYNIRTSQDLQSINLKWNNPDSKYFDYVRVMRNTDRYHSSPFAGKLVYEGKGESASDKYVESGQKYYYTFYSREISGDFSSGVGVVVYFNRAPNIQIQPTPEPIKKGDSLPHFIVIQNGEVINTVDDVDKVSGNDAFEIQNTPGTFLGFEDIWVEITYPEQSDIKAYLFTYDKENKVYQTSIPALKNKGDYEVRVYGFNKDHNVLLSEGVISVTSDLNAYNRPISTRDTLVWSFWLLICSIFILWLKKLVE